MSAPQPPTNGDQPGTGADATSGNAPTPAETPATKPITPAAPKAAPRKAAPRKTAAATGAARKTATSAGAARQTTPRTAPKASAEAENAAAPETVQTKVLPTTDQTEVLATATEATPSAEDASPKTDLTPTELPPTELPPTEVPQGELAPSEPPQAEVPPTLVPPTLAAPTLASPTLAPQTVAPPTVVPPNAPPATEPPQPAATSEQPPTSEQPFTTAPPTAPPTAHQTTPPARTITEVFADRLDNDGFFSALFDLTFTRYVTRKLAGPVYIVGLVLIGLSTILALIYWLGNAIGTNSFLGAFVFLFGLIITVVGSALAILLLRVAIEVFVAIIAIAENTRPRRKQGP